MLNEFLSIIFPNLCHGCKQPLSAGEVQICIKCLAGLPTFHFTDFQNSELMKQMTGRLELHGAYTYLQFHKKSEVQNLFHSLKYRGNKGLGTQLGSVFAYRSSAHWKDVDALVPVPLHKRKLKERGYNQSLAICEGMSERSGIPIQDILLRTQYTSTQTRKSRIDRIRNLEGVFEVKRDISLQHQHILLVDDVFTTGATLEASGQALMEGGLEKLSIAVLASGK